MKKSEAREKAIDYLFAASESFYSISAKTTIDDKGTLSKNGYSDEDCADIEKELDFIMRKVLKMKLK